jgi:hypothetical protein
MIGRKEGFWLSGFFNGVHSFPPQKILDFYLKIGRKGGFCLSGFFNGFHSFYFMIGRRMGFWLSGFFRPNKKH